MGAVPNIPSSVRLSLPHTSQESLEAHAPATQGSMQLIGGRGEWGSGIPSSPAAQWSGFDRGHMSRPWTRSGYEWIPFQDLDFRAQFLSLINSEGGVLKTFEYGHLLWATIYDTWKHVAAKGAGSRAGPVAISLGPTPWKDTLHKPTSAGLRWDRRGPAKLQMVSALDPQTLRPALE